MKGHLIVMMGAPGSGKSTFASQYEHVVSADVLEGQDIDRSHIARVFREAYLTIGRLLTRGHEVVFDTTAAHPVIRSQALQVARERGAKATLAVLDTDLATCLAAQETRERKVPASVVTRVHAAIQVQLEDVADEGWNEVKVIRREGVTQ